MTRPLTALLASLALAVPQAHAAPAVAAQYMASAANPHATRAGVAVLADGGSAIDAAIAMQMVLNVVEPQSSGIGGGAFLLHFDAGSGQVAAYDGRETAPAAAGEDLFRDASGEPMKWRAAVVGGRAVGVPGLLAMLKLAHDRHGKLPWANLFAPAIAVAADGFAVSPRLNQLIGANAEHGLGRYPAAQKYFFTAAGEPLPVGHLLKNPQLAATFSRIAAEGPAAFYRGEIARSIVAAVDAATDNPGKLALQDLAGYRAVERKALCAPYRQYTVCGMPPPTSGGVTTLQILGLLAPFDLGSMELLAPDTVHIYTQAAKLAYADRALYLADPDFVDVPAQQLLDPAYLAQRAGLINLGADFGTAGPGAPGASPELPSTTHLAVVDAQGNAVSLTSSIENAFGSTLMAAGFLLNNQLTDFSFRAAGDDGAPIANRVQANKRPRSSMAPTIVLNADGSLHLVVGSPGGSRIINYVAKTLIAALDYGMDMQSAIDVPHFANRNGATDLEQDTAAADLAPALEQMGHKVNVRALTSGLHGIKVTARGLEGGADPRREGVALGN